MQARGLVRSTLTESRLLNHVLGFHLSGSTHIRDRHYQVSISGGTGFKGPPHYGWPSAQGAGPSASPSRAASPSSCPRIEASRLWAARARGARTRGAPAVAPWAAAALPPLKPLRALRLTLAAAFLTTLLLQLVLRAFPGPDPLRENRARWTPAGP